MREDEKRGSFFPRLAEGTQSQEGILRSLRVLTGIFGVWAYCFCSPVVVASEDFPRHLEAAGHLEKEQWKEAWEIYRELSARVEEPLRLHALLGLDRRTAVPSRHRVVRAELPQKHDDQNQRRHGHAHERPSQQCLLLLLFRLSFR